MVEVVEIFALLITIIQRPDRLVTFIEAWWETTKQLGHGDITLAIAPVTGRIKNDRSGHGEGGVAVPKITMEL